MYKILDILNQNEVPIVFGDNANLSMSVGQAIGALSTMGPDPAPAAPKALLPVELDCSGSKLTFKQRVELVASQLETFLENQSKGYASLYDAEDGRFYFGKEVHLDRLMGTSEKDGIRKALHSDYLANEFRAPTGFVVMRFGTPVEAFGNLGFEIRPYTLQDGKLVFPLISYDGSGFQGLGLNAGHELTNTSWRRQSQNFLNVLSDFSRRNQLPGFLSESYVGPGVYTAAAGIPELAIDSQNRTTHAPSLYALGAAFEVNPQMVESLLNEHWDTIKTLQTDHGPWEGYNVRDKKKVEVQTTAHTLSLALGLGNNSVGNMKRYLENKGLEAKLKSLYPSGEKTVLKGGLTSAPKNLSGGIMRLNLRYNNSADVTDAKVVLVSDKSVGHFPKQIHLPGQKGSTQSSVVQYEIPLPASPGLTQIKQLRIDSSQAGSSGIEILDAEFFPD